MKTDLGQVQPNSRATKHSVWKTVAAIITGFVTWILVASIWIANGDRRAAMYFGILLLALFIPNHYLLWDKFPVWYHLTFLVSLFPLTLLGAMLKLPGGRMRSVVPLQNSA